MKTNRLPTTLRRAALATLVVGIAIWAAAGARLGWTQTSVVSIQRDEITGIDFPVRHSAFVPGVEVPLLAFAAASVLAGLSWATARRSAVSSTVNA